MPWHQLNTFLTNKQTPKTVKDRQSYNGLKRLYTHGNTGSVANANILMVDPEIIRYRCGKCIPGT